MRVIVGIDGGEQQQDALALGATLAQVEGGHITIAFVYPWSQYSVRLGTAFRKTIRDDAEALLLKAKETVCEVPCSIRAVPHMSPARALHHLADEEHADVLVVGSCHRGAVGRTLLGGAGDRILHGAPCALAVAPRGYAEMPRGMRRIGVGYDASPAARDALEWATKTAEAVGGSITMFTVVEPIAPVGYAGGLPYDVDEIEKPIREEAQRHLDEAIARQPSNVETTGELLRGAAPHALASAAADVDLLVTGSRDYGPVRSVLLGSVAHGLLHESPRPLVVVPRTSVAAPAEPLAEDTRVGAAR